MLRENVFLVADEQDVMTSVIRDDTLAARTRRRHVCRRARVADTQYVGHAASRTATTSP